MGVRGCNKPFLVGVRGWTWVDMGVRGCTWVYMGGRGWTYIVSPFKIGEKIRNVTSKAEMLKKHISFK